MAAPFPHFHTTHTTTSAALFPLLLLLLLFVFVFVFSSEGESFSQFRTFPANMLQPGTSLQFLQLFTLLLCFFFTITQSSDDELQILLKFKDTFQKSNNNFFDSWKSDSNSPCEFTGISCNTDKSVIQIELPNINLAGNLPLDSICQLQSLERLNLGGNFLNGVVTKDLKNCTKLQYLDLAMNQFTGSFPEFESLERLTHLNLNLSGFSGLFPWKSLVKMTNLTFLSVGDNQFDPTPFPVEVFNLKIINWLYLANCTLQGKIPPEIGDLIELTNLELSSNNLTGDIPLEIGKLKKLTQLELYENQLTGRLHGGFGNLTKLEFLDASDNYLEGDISELKYLTNLISLQLFLNNLEGEIPVEFGDFKYLVNLSLYTNKFTGELPQKLGYLSNFDFIDVSENQFSGPIPPDMCKNGQMKELLILQNKFTGGIPASYANCLSMTRFRVSNNSLSGIVPSGLWALPKLSFMDLALNKFEGTLTSDIGNAKSLEQLHLQGNLFTGEMPLEISKPPSLGLIDLSFNAFTGQIPVTIGELKKLNSFYLQDNTFSGSIPESLASCSSLNNINLAGNFLTGSIPAALGSLPSLNSLNLSKNRLTGKIPDSLSYLKLSLFDLSNNLLTGQIPQSLSTQAYNGSFVGNPGLCSLDINYIRRCTSSDSGKSSHIRRMVACLLVGITILLISLVLFILAKRRISSSSSSSSSPKSKSFTSSDSWNLKSFSVLTFTEQEVLNAINEDNIIGKGGSGDVYRVVLKNGAVELAVKHIWNAVSTDDKKSYRSSTAMLMKRSGNSPEFDAEVTTLSSIRHVNVVKLYCSITSEDSSLLVYEYLPNGSLWDRLHTCQKMELDWETRYEIGLGAGKGLEYLHHGIDRPVIHRDVKSSNILLDEFFKPRIADFGLAKMIVQGGGGPNKDLTHVIAGTHGYIAPEYAYTYKVTEKSDVYSFGVVLMELVTGKRPIEPEFGENKDIVYWICSRMTSRESILGVVDSSIPEMFKEDAIKVLRIAVSCTARLPALRPSMRTVVQMLKEAEPCKLITISVVKEKNTDLIKKDDNDAQKLKMTP